MANLYCDLAIDGTILWAGVVCLNNTMLDSYPYLGFVGHLAFADYQGVLDPDYTGIGPGGRFALLYYQAGAPALQVPLQAIPAQQLDVTLGGQNCTLSIYQK